MSSTPTTKKRKRRDDTLTITAWFNGTLINVNGWEQVMYLIENGGYGHCSSSRERQPLRRYKHDRKRCRSEQDRQNVDERYMFTYRTLFLNMVEAFFLAFDNTKSDDVMDGKVASVVIRDVDTKRKMSKTNAWKLFQSLNPRFLELYATYRHFRWTGWSLRSGLKFGADFLLYELGAKNSHSAFMAIVRNVSSSDAQLSVSNSDGIQVNGRDRWPQWLGVMRSAVTTRKRSLLCFVTVPSDSDTTEPSVVERITVEKSILKRWAPGK